METTTNKATETMTVHVKDHRGVRHYPATQHADAALCQADPVEFLRQRAESHFRGHCRTDWRASVTVGSKVVARAYFVDPGFHNVHQSMRIVAEARG